MSGTNIANLMCIANNVAVVAIMATVTVYADGWWKLLSLPMLLATIWPVTQEINDEK